MSVLSIPIKYLRYLTSKLRDFTRLTEYVLFVTLYCVYFKAKNTLVIDNSLPLIIYIGY